MTRRALLSVLCCAVLAMCSDPEEPELVWSVQTGDASTGLVALGNDGSIIAAGHTVSNFGRGQLRSFGSDGTQRWVVDSPGLFDQPVVGVDGRIWVTTDGSLWNVTAAGEPLWAADASGPFALAENGAAYVLEPNQWLERTGQSLLVEVYDGGYTGFQVPVWGLAQDLVIAGNGIIHVPVVEYSGKAGVRGIGLDGAQRWSVPLPAPPRPDPAVDAGATVYVGTEAGLTAIGGAGSVLWNAELEGGARSPVLAPGRRIVAISDQKVVGLDAGGNLLWKTSTLGATGLAVGSDGRIFASGAMPESYDRRYGLAVMGDDGGDLRWFTTNGDNSLSPPVLGGGQAYVSSVWFLLQNTYPTAGGIRASTSYFAYLEAFGPFDDVSLARTPWPRTAGGNHNRRAGATVQINPLSPDLIGHWATTLGQTTHVVRFGKELYELWSYPTDALPKPVERGTWTFADGHVHLTTTWHADDPAQVDQTRSRAVLPSTPWQLVMADPLDTQTRTWRRVRGPPVAPSAAPTGGKTQWLHSLGGPGSNTAHALARRDDGQMIVVMSTLGELWLPTGPTAPLDTTGFNVAGFTDAGLQWIERVDEVPEQWTVRGVAVDSADRIAILGDHSLDTSMPHIIDLTSAGKYVSGWRLELPDEVRHPGEFAETSGGDLVLAGLAEVDEPGDPRNGWVGDIFVTRVAPDRTVVWDQRVAADGHQGAMAVAVGADEHIVVAGHFQGTIDVGTGPISAAGNDLFVMELDADGAALWVRNFTSLQHRAPEHVGVAVDAHGNIAVAGLLEGAINLGHGVLETSKSGQLGDSDVFVASLDTDGQPRWSHRLGGPQDYGLFGAIGVDEHGNVTVAGQLGNGIEIDDKPLKTKRSLGFFAVQFNTCGALAWTKEFRECSDCIKINNPLVNTQSAGTVRPTDIDVASDGSVAITGIFDGGVKLTDAALLWRGGMADAFVGVFKGAEAPDEPLSCAPAAEGGVQVKVVLDGTGDGTVVSDPAGIACPGECSATFDSLSEVTLTATAGAASRFEGWSGAGCAGVDECTLIANADKTITATFERPAIIWTLDYGDDPSTSATALAVSDDGLAFVAGHYYKTMELGGQTLTSPGQNSAYVSRHGLHGAVEWVQPIEGTGNEVVESVAIDSNGEVVITGTTSSPELEVGADAPVPATTSADTFVLRYTAAGKHVWSRRYPQGQYHLNRGDIDAQGRTTVMAYTATPLDFGTATVEAAGPFAFAVSRQGDLLWVRSFGDLDVRDHALSDAGEPVLAGAYTTTRQLGDSTLEHVGEEDLFVTKTTFEGETLWARSLAGDKADVPLGVDVGADGTVVVLANTYTPETTFDVDPVAGSNEYGKGFIWALSPTGETKWIRRIGDVFVWGQSVAVDGLGGVAIGASHKAHVDLGQGPLPSGENFGAFVGRFDSLGGPLWSTNKLADSIVVAGAVAISASGRVVAAHKIEPGPVSLTQYGQ